MPKERILRNHFESIFYSSEQWTLLKEKRDEALVLLEMFEKEGLFPFIYGSIARGNVHPSSDIDIIFTQQAPIFQIEYILNKNGLDNNFKEIIMATPNDSLRLYIHISELECITIPITKMERNTMEFYKFGGKIDINQLRSQIRVTGIDKRLVLIKPTSEGHEEISIIGNEPLAAKEVGIAIATINERKKVLLRRERYGRTGVFLKRIIQKDESTEEVLRDLAKKKSLIRKKMFQK